MKLPLLLGALLLSATPVVANDYVYLKCSGTLKNTVFDWNRTKELNHWDSNTEILYKIDAKNKVLFVSSKPEIAIQYELQHPGFISFTEQFSEGRISGENRMYLQYDPPGVFYGAMFHLDQIRNLKYSGLVNGSCEASDASAHRFPRDR